MHPLLLIVFIFVIAYIAYVLSKQQSGESQSRTNQRMWAEAAHGHNLSLFPPNEQSVFPSMAGKIDGLPVEVWGDFDEKTGHGLVFCRANFTRKLPLRLSIVKGGFPTESAGATFEIRGLTAPGISVTAANGKDLQSFLTIQNMNVLKNCMGSYHSAKLTESFLILGAGGINDGMSFHSFIDRTVSAAKALSGSSVVPVHPEHAPIPSVEDSKDIFAPVVTPVQEKTVITTAPAIPITPPADIPPPKPVPAPSPLESPAPEAKPEPVESSAALDLSAEGLSKALFSASFPGEKEKNLFKGVIGQTVQWKGKLKSVYPYSSDFVFGKGPGAKATFEICEVESGYGVKNKVKATVSLGEETLAVLKGETGKEFTFSGTLLKMEPFSREILLEKGSLPG